MKRLGTIASLMVASLLPLGTGASAQALEPTYADVLRQPDDPAVNLAYALKLVREGHLNSAAATLERLLLVHPEADDVRLTYMIVLMRLDDMVGAKREADILAGRKLPGKLAGEYERYSKQIVARAKPTKIAAYLGSGFRVDAGISQFEDPAIQNRRKQDVSYISMAGIAVTHDFTSGIIDRAFAQLDIGSTMHARNDDYNFMSGKAEAGIEKRFDNLVLRLSGFGSGSMVGGEAYGREYGGRASATYEISSAFKIFADTSYSTFSYDDIKVAENEALHDGNGWRAGGGVIVQLNDQHQITVQGHWAEKDARSDVYSYTMRDIEARWLGTFVGGQYMTISGRYAEYDYDAFDAIYGDTREDAYLRARVSYGLPVRTIAERMGVDTSGFFFNFGELVLQTSVDYVRQDSNISAFDFSSFGGEVLLTRRFLF